MRATHFGLASFVVAASLSIIPSLDAGAGIIYTFTGASGLAGEAEFTLVNPTTLQVRLRNISTGVPGGFDSSDQLLTSVAFDLPGATSILSGIVLTGASSSTVGFSITNVGPNGNVSGEWGYGNGGTTGFGSLVNYITSNTAGATAFDPFTNMDGPGELDGPQGGLVASPAIVALGGIGAIQDEIVATITLSAAVADLSFLDNGVMIEFGSDAAFIVPAPGALALLALAGVASRGRRRR